jgi:hypothetical protein
MADKKISQLTGAATPLAGTEVLPIVQSGSTVKVAVSDLTAGRAVSTGALTASGNVRTQYSATGNVSLVANNTSTAAGATSQIIGTNDASRSLRIQYSSSGGAGGSAVTNGITTETAQIFTDASYPLVLGTNASAAAILDTSQNVKLINNLIIGTSGKGIVDTNGNESLMFTATASAVNEFTITNAASGNSPTFSATGSGADIDVRLLPKGTGDVRALNKLRITSSAEDTNARLATKLTSVSTSATDISPIGNTWGNLCIVTGLDSGGAFFTDLVFTSATAGATVLSAKTISGSPAARTYTMSGSDILQVAMASGTYNIHCAVFSGLN